MWVVTKKQRETPAMVVMKKQRETPQMAGRETPASLRCPFRGSQWCFRQCHGEKRERVLRVSEWVPLCQSVFRTLRHVILHKSAG